MLHIMNQKKRRGRERRAEQRGGNIMDKGSNEAERERWREKGEEDGERNVEGRGRKEAREGEERRARCRVGSRRGGCRGREARECASLPAFLTLRLCLYAEQRQRKREMEERNEG